MDENTKMDIFLARELLEKSDGRRRTGIITDEGGNVWDYHQGRDLQDTGFMLKILEEDGHTPIGGYHGA